MIPVKDEDDDEYKIKIDINIDIDNEIEEIINKQIKDIKIDDNLNDEIEFDKDKYKDKLEKQTKNYISDIKKQLDLVIKKIYDEKTQIHKSNILNIIDNQNKTRVDIINNVNKNTSSLKNDFNELVNGTNEMKIHLGELKDNLEKNPNKKIYYENNIVFDRNDDGDNDNDDDNNNDNDDDNYNDDENDDDDKVKFLRPVIKDEVLDTNCTSIKIDNIRIENKGNKTLDKLYFIRDEKSSKEFIISQSTNINCCRLNSTGVKFDHGKIESHSITLEIKKPIVDQTYYLWLYIRENKNGKNISKPLEISYTIREDLEATIRKKEEEEKREKEEEEKREKEEEEKRRKEEEEKRKKEEEEKRKEEEEKREKEEEEKRKKKRREELSPATLDKEAIELFNGLVKEYKYNIDLTNDKDDVYLKIIELNYDRNAVVEWINELMQ